MGRDVGIATTQGKERMQNNFIHIHKSSMVSIGLLSPITLGGCTIMSNMPGMHLAKIGTYNRLR